MSREKRNLDKQNKRYSQGIIAAENQPNKQKREKKASKNKLLRLPTTPTKLVESVYPFFTTFV
jgi:hypothetical protein